MFVARARPCATACISHARIPGVRSYHVAFLGTDAVSVATLKKLHESMVGGGPFPNLIKDLTVICPSDRPAGRGKHTTAMVVKEFATHHELKREEVPYGLKSLNAWECSSFPLQPGNPQFDLGVVVSFGYFIPPHILNAMRLGALNMHPSLLPKYRGAAPIVRAIASGEVETGVSIIGIHPEKFDAGMVYKQVVVPMLPDEPCSKLTPRLAEIGANQMLECIANFESLSKTAVAQGGQVTKAPKVKAEEGILILSQDLTVNQVMIRWRAFDDSVGTHTYFAFGKPAGPKRVKLCDIVRLDAHESSALPAGLPVGHLVYEKVAKSLYMSLADGYVRINSLQRDFKTVITGQEFANGFHITRESGHTFVNNS